MNDANNLISIGLVFLLAWGLLFIIRSFLRSTKRKLFSYPANANLNLSLADGSGKTPQGRPRRISLPVLLKIADREIPATARDLRPGGTFVACRYPLPLNSRLCVVIEIPGKEPLLLNAEVIWSNSNVLEKNVVVRGMGVRFSGNGAEEFLRLTRLIAALSEERVEGIPMAEDETDDLPISTGSDPLDENFEADSKTPAEKWQFPIIPTSHGIIYEKAYREALLADDDPTALDPAL